MNKHVFSKMNRKNTTKDVDLDENEYGDLNEEESMNLKVNSSWKKKHPD